MVVTERTRLLRATDPTTSVEFAGISFTRPTKIRQFQCCLFAFLIAIIIMVLVATVSYSIHKSESLVENSINPSTIRPSPSLKATWLQGNPDPENSNEVSEIALTSTEWDAAVEAGQKAITSRIQADTLCIPLPSPSPNSRHQSAVKTSLRAGELALGGIGELAASRYVERFRVKLGKPSSMGSYFKNIWVPADACKEFFTKMCSPSKYRNFDGTCNHPRNLGAALTPFIRLIPADYSDKVELPRCGKFGKALPSPREISLKVHPPAPSSNPEFTVMLAVFGQFLDHDITATAISQGTNGSSLSCCPVTANTHPECFPVEVGPGDPVFDSAGRNCMEFVRSAPAPQCKIAPREQLNQVTSFIDGSVIYGSDRVTAKGLREGKGGLLRMFKTPDNRTLLPQSTNPNDGCNRDVEIARGRYCFASGDGRANENLHLTTMHLLWARQHNKVAETLSQINPQWNDEKIYQEARRIIGAQLQYITYNEFIPVVLGEREVNVRQLKPLSTGFRRKNGLTQVNPAVANSFAASAFRFAHTLLPGLMKVTESQKATVSFEELHRMLFNPYSLYAKGGMETSLTTATSNSIQKTTTHVTSQLTKHLFEDPLGNASIPCGLDLVSLNIQRGRDHGLPGYTAWRKHCGLSEVQTFDELRGEMDSDAWDQISKLYDHVDDVDLYTGALAEINQADGLVGPTFKCIIGDQFSRLQQGDRFWHEVSGEPQSFTEGQLKQIRKTTLAKLICDCSNEIYQIQPEVMRSVNEKNSMISCEDIPGVDFSEWKDAPLPVLKAIPTGSEDQIADLWANFTKEINKSVNELVHFFGNTTSTPRSTDWTAVKDWIHKSFAELQNDVLTLHKKTIETTKSPSSNLQTTNEFDVKFLKSPKSGFTKDETLVSMESRLNGSLTDSTKFVKSSIKAPPRYSDWVNFRNDIKITLNNAVVNATGIPTPDQRTELMRNISIEIERIKRSIASIGATKLSLANETALTSGGATLVWLNLKVDMVKAVTDALNRIENEAPALGDSAWTTYGTEIKKQFHDIAGYMYVSPNNKPVVKNESAVTYLGSQNPLNKLPNNSDTGIDDNMTKLQNTLRPSLNNSLGLFKHPSAKQRSTKELIKDDMASMDFWSNFSNTLNNSIRAAAALNAGKTLRPNDPAWMASSEKIMDVFFQFKHYFFEKNNNSILNFSKSTQDPLIDVLWENFRNSFTDSIYIAYRDIASKSPPADDAAWAAFGSQIMNNFLIFKDIFSTLRVETGSSNVTSKLEKVDPIDWYSFKTDIIHSVIFAVNKINNNTSTLNTTAWAEFTGRVINELGKIPSDAASKRSMTTENVRLESSSSKGDTFDWVSFKNDIKQSVSEINDKMQILWSLVPEDPQWTNLRTQSPKPNTTFENIKSATDVTAPKLDELQFSLLTEDWTRFKEKLNKSLVDAIGSTPPQDNPIWASFRDSIKDEFSALKIEVASLKFDGSSEVRTVSEETIVTDNEYIQLQKTVRSNQHFSESVGNLISPREKTNEMFEGSMKTVDSMNVAELTPFIPAADWIAFKREIDVLVLSFARALNGTDAEEWKETKDLIKKLFIESRNDIVTLRNRVIALP